MTEVESIAVVDEVVSAEVDTMAVVEEGENIEHQTCAENGNEQAEFRAEGVAVDNTGENSAENSAEKALARDVVGDRRRGQAKGKAKGKGKKKNSAKAKSKSTAVIEIMEGEEGAPPNPQPEKRLGLKQKMAAEIGNRDIDEIIKEAKEQVTKLQESLKAAQQEYADFETSVIEGKSKMHAADAFVNECIQKESAAFEKFKIAREAALDASNKLLEKKVVLATDDKVLAVLVSEGEMRSKESDLRKAKDDASEVAAAAHKALKEAKGKEREANEAIKKRRCTIDDAEVEESMKEVLAKATEHKTAKLDVKQRTNAAERTLKDEFKELEKARLEREKSRSNAVREAAGFGRISKRAMLTDGSEAPFSPSKVAKIEEPLA